MVGMLTPSQAPSIPLRAVPCFRLVAVPTGGFLHKAQIVRTFCVWNLRATKLPQYHRPSLWVCPHSSRGAAGDFGAIKWTVAFWAVASPHLAKPRHNAH